MPGFEVIDNKELLEIETIFNEGGGILFRHGFESIRKDSYKVKTFEESFAKYHNINFGLALTSGTAALRVALASLGITKGDEVITQAFTFVATVEAIVESGATPVCANIDETLNLDPYEIEKLITPRTKALIAVHMLGTPCKIDLIKEICDKNNIFLIEDTAWGCGGSLKSKPLGTWGSVGAFSFDFAKTMTTGEGGMLITDNKDIYLKAAAWHDHGHENNPNLPRWEDTRSSSGFNFRMMELQGAIGIVQLKKLNRIIESQRANVQLIWENIKDINYLEKRFSPKGSYETGDALVIKLPSSKEALNCRKELLKFNISTKILPEAISWHFAGFWTHIKELNQKHKNLKKDFLPSHEKLSKYIALPISVKMKEDIPDKIRKALKSALT